MKRFAIDEPASDASSPADIGAINQYVSQRIRRRRVLLGLTQQELAEMIGITPQQAHKYEKGLCQISSGRLYQIAQALGVEVSHFFESVDPEGTVKPVLGEFMQRQRTLQGLVRIFTSLTIREHQVAICHMARSLSKQDCHDS